MSRSRDVPCDPGRVVDRLLTPVTVVGSAVGLALVVVGVVSDPHVVPAGPVLIIGGATIALLVLAWPAITAVTAGLPFAQVALSPTAAADRRGRQSRQVQQVLVDCAELLVVDPAERAGAVERSLEAGYRFNKRRADELELFLLCALVRRARTIDLTSTSRPGDHPVHHFPLAQREAWVLTDVAYLSMGRAAAILGSTPQEVQAARDDVVRQLQRAKADE
ncbi:hypothetical protein ACPPVT_06440 [Angustibacter sp. McL0619]|uniref:hypothetical protein n=1 Tax=Angustibacter sp. McL0619 TaxID=3415676 RepID=UPI003CEA1014